MRKKLTKAELFEEIRIEREELEKAIGALNKKQMTTPGVTDRGWSVKDVLAHLMDWEQRFLGWYEAGKRGQALRLPAPGMNWGDLPELNQQIFDKYRRRTLDNVLGEFRTSYRMVLKTLRTISDQELTNPGRYVWTGKWTLADFAAANTCDHYHWATALIRKWARSQKIAL